VVFSGSVALSPSKGADAVFLPGPPGGEFVIPGVVIVGVFEPGDDGAAEKSEFAVADETSALPYSGGNYDLNLLAREQIMAENHEAGSAVGVKLKHLDGIAEVEVEDLVGLEHVHFGELALLEQVVDRRALGTGATGQIECGGSGPGLPEMSAFDGMGIEL
jgi:hypothetical protein